jgi:localization factor PodJL
VPQPERAAEDLKDLEAAARHGDSEAQFRIGTRFLSDGAFSNGGAATAARWLARAAGQGHLEAQFMLASLYERGAGVTKDENEAMSLYRKAANAGHIRAMHNLGVLLSARESPQDYSEAAVWFARAAQAGLTDSQYNLALLYERGLGVEQDLSRAYLWYRAAGRGGDKEAARQAERLKRALPAGGAGTQASSWRPALEDRSKAANGNNSRG